MAWFDRCVHDCARDKVPIDALLYGVLCMVCFLCGAGESRCRQYEESSCKYGGHCNFMHIKRPSRDVCKRLGIRTTYEAARGGGGGPGGGGGGGEARHTFTNALRKFSCGHMFVLSDLYFAACGDYDGCIGAREASRQVARAAAVCMIWVCPMMLMWRTNMFQKSLNMSVHRLSVRACFPICFLYVCFVCVCMCAARFRSYHLCVCGHVLYERIRWRR